MTFFAAASSYDPVDFNQSLANHKCTFKPEVYKDPRLDPDMSTAVLSYTFGNYRSELDLVARYKPAFADYDWFLFSDSTMSLSTIDAFVEHGWFLCGMTARIDIVECARHNEQVLSSGFLKNHGKLLAKYYKFGHIPSVLLRYEWILHVSQQSCVPTKPKPKKEEQIRGHALLLCLLLKKQGAG